ncbi:MAG: hypothetical protein IJ171_06565 [Ruminococcus sp.]|nr:hypothetical protein [Ruminococcus sp.]
MEAGGYMSEIMEIRQQVRLNQWSAMVQEREDSGLSVEAFCKQAGIAPKTYYYRLRRLREAAIKKTQMETLQPTTSQPELVQYTLPTGYVAEPTTQSIVIRTSSTTVEIPMNTNPEVVAAAVSFLKQS